MKMENEEILKWLLLIGGIIEIIVGILFFFIAPLFESYGISSIPLFIQMSGAFFISFGILLIYASKDCETYKIIPLTNILFRFLVLVPVVYAMITYPQFLPMLMFTLIYDTLWSILVLVLLKKCDFI